MSYALYKFHKAILSLEGTDLQRKQWLCSSYMHHIVHLRDTDVPDLLRPEFRALRSQLTRVPGSGPMATLEETVKTMEDGEINAVIRHIIAFYESLRRYEHAASPA